jgi:hypothetical protein
MIVTRTIIETEIETGIEIETVMPGMGGKTRTRAQAIDTYATIN